ncbi:MAG: 23S rRNA (pseudouridine(1915)-N(3))-methyltransferase RlmH [Chitinophagaceae bacterium]|nr:23S rRNA (pseudouridine(1915)-N(3))-methyltransferase RlmH [Chitinophagaceae bacterium]
MKIELISVGKPHDKELKNAIEDFTARIKKYFSVEWKIIPNPKNAASMNEVELKRTESESILQLVQPDDYLILLDETGKNISSVELANFIQQRANSSCKKLIFLIGGAFGVDEKINHRAQFIWSLSKLVFPHMIVRLILAEQVYRACSILRNEKYHHI